MSEQLDALYQLQLVDLDLEKYRKALAALDDGSSRKEQVERLRVLSAEAEQLLHEASTEQRDKELNVKAVEDKKKQFQEKMYSGKVANPKELQSMQDEIAMLDRQRGKLEERILELMDLIEERKAVHAEAAERLRQSEDKLAAHTAKLAENTRILQKNIEILTHRRDTALSHVDPGLLKRYQSLQARVGVLAVGKIEGNQCGGCHTGLMPFQLRQLDTDKDILTCENCGRILFKESK
ncbi:MAG: hypothetical protein KBC96_03270 [Armatimonadetes bacterium]|nr:hypothetical protein [Armatimonadota bacterium]